MKDTMILITAYEGGALAREATAEGFVEVKARKKGAEERVRRLHREGKRVILTCRFGEEPLAWIVTHDLALSGVSRGTTLWANTNGDEEGTREFVAQVAAE
jgi:hypothetical protein